MTIHQTDAAKGIEGEGYDAAIIDVGDPWPLIPLVHGVLLGGAPVMSFSPTFNQVERTTETFAKVGFVNVHTLECFIREIRAETGKTQARHHDDWAYGIHDLRPEGSSSNKRAV